MGKTHRRGQRLDRQRDRTARRSNPSRLRKGGYGAGGAAGTPVVDYSDFYYEDVLADEGDYSSGSLEGPINAARAEAAADASAGAPAAAAAVAGEDVSGDGSASSDSDTPNIMRKRAAMPVMDSLYEGPLMMGSSESISTLDVDTDSDSEAGTADDGHPTAGASGGSDAGGSAATGDATDGMSWVDQKVAKILAEIESHIEPAKLVMLKGEHLRKRLDSLAYDDDVDGDETVDANLAAVQSIRTGIYECVEKLERSLIELDRLLPPPAASASQREAIRTQRREVVRMIQEALPALDKLKSDLRTVSSLVGPTTDARIPITNLVAPLHAYDDSAFAPRKQERSRQRFFHSGAARAPYTPIAADIFPPEIVTENSMDDVFADEPGPTTPTSPPVELADAEQRREARAVEDRAEIELRQRFLEQQRHLARLMEEESDATAASEAHRAALEREQHSLFDLLRSQAAASAADAAEAGPIVEEPGEPPSRLPSMPALSEMPVRTFQDLKLPYQLYELLNNQEHQANYGNVIRWVDRPGHGRLFFMDPSEVGPLVSLDPNALVQRLRGAGFDSPHETGRAFPHIYRYPDPKAIRARRRRRGGKARRRGKRPKLTVNTDRGPAATGAAAVVVAPARPAGMASANATGAIAVNNEAGPPGLEPHIRSASAAAMQAAHREPVQDVVAQLLRNVKVWRQCARCLSTYDVLANTATSCRAHAGRYVGVYMVMGSRRVFTGDRAWSCCHQLSATAAGCQACDHVMVDVSVAVVDEAGVGEPSILIQ